MGEADSIRALLFDFDGTLWDSESAVFDAYRRLYAAHGDLERAKPSPGLYAEALAAVDARASEAVAIEDSPNGIAAAKAAGVFCLAVPNEVTAELDLSAADLLVDSLEDLPLEELLEAAAASQAAERPPATDL